ncbi:hypothetical protein FQA39_LY03022 [Lamprigera yunnana]|nr:hypothetical protein FQA39_LY03022 [Lamprigera yunnana]
MTFKDGALLRSNGSSNESSSDDDCLDTVLYHECVNKAVINNIATDSSKRSARLFSYISYLALMVVCIVLVKNSFNAIPVNQNIDCTQQADIYKKLRQIEDDIKIMKLKYINIPTDFNITFTEISKTINNEVHQVLQMYDADKLSIIDYAWHLSGGSVTSTPDTAPYDKAIKHSSNPNILIQSGTLPGECFAFKGQIGRVRIELTSFVRITAITMEHTPKCLVLDITSAPKDFRVYGLDDASGPLKHDFGLFEYILEGNSLQTFLIKEKNLDLFAYKHIELHILSNHGNSEYTCVYRFRVHGEQ